jgi:hypothetical protein
LGVPTTSTKAWPSLSFTKDGSSDTLHAIKDANQVVNQLTVGSSSSGLKCSFAGGCQYQLKSAIGKGVVSLLKHFPDDNYVQVCEKKCTFIEADSSAGDVRCSLPRVSTTYSNENYGIAQVDENLNSQKFFGNRGSAQLAFDDNIFTIPGIYENDCHIGMEFREGYVGMIS